MQDTKDLSGQELKQVIKEAIAEALQENRNWLREIVAEVLEERAIVPLAKGHAIHTEADEPYDWQPGELEAAKPVQYVPGQGLVIEA